MDDSLTMCLALRDAGYQSDIMDYEANNAKYDIQDGDSLEVINEKNKGWRWEKHPTFGWYPNPGRKALMDEIVKIIGQDAFDAQYGKGDTIHQSLSHEQWGYEWMNHKKVADAKRTNDKPNTVAEGAGASEESAGDQV